MTSVSAGDAPEATWIEAARRGDRGAYSELALCWYRRTLAFCHARLPQLSDAEDAAQETLIRALTHLSELRSVDQFAPWLRGIAMNVCRDFWRQRQRTPPCSELGQNGIEFASTMSVSEQLESQDERAEVWRAIGQLDESLREVILLHYFDQLTYDQMAAWLGVARATVQERLTKARQRLRFQLVHKLEPPRSSQVRIQTKKTDKRHEL